METLSLWVNGHRHELKVDPTTPLLYILRNDLGLTGAKFGCGSEQCGACKVLIDDQPQYSCTIAVEAVQEQEIVTIEGLGTVDDLHPVQAAFVAARAAQCGYCIPGMVIAAKALLDNNSTPSEAEIGTALRDHLCRCGSHPRIIKAIKRASEALTT